MRLLLNGRFLGRPLTGVDRIALQIIRAMRELLAETGAAVQLDVVVPPDMADPRAKVAELGEPVPDFSAVGRLRGHGWEQVDLPGVRPADWLLSLCNVGPMRRKRQAVVMCDALYIEHPDAYSRVFRTWYRILQTVLGRRADLVFTISEYSKAALERYRLVPPGKAHVLRMGADHVAALEADDRVLDRIAVRPGGYLLAVGSLTRHKNLRTLIDAFIAARLDGIDLVVAGGGNARIFQGAGLPEAPNIHYTGRVTDEELKALYLNAMAFACPSLSEGFGLPPLEAMACGCPVIATTGGAVPEACGDAAVYADPLDTAAWTRMIARVAGDPDLRADLSRRGIAHAATYTWRQAAAGMLRVLARHDGDQALLAAFDRAIDRKAVPPPPGQNVAPSIV